MLPSRALGGAAAVLALTLGAPAALASTKVDYGPLSHKRHEDGRGGVDEPEAAAADRLRGGPVGHPERDQGGQQPGLVVLRQVPVAVDAAEQVRGLLVEAQGGRQRVQVRRDHREGRRHPPARERDGERRQGAEDVRGQVEGLQDRLAARRWRCRSNTPKLPKGIKGNVDTVAGMRLQLSGGSSSAARAAVVADGGTPTRTGTPAFGCVPTTFPGALASSSGLYPNQILAAYGIAPLQAAGLQGQGLRLAIVGEAPTPAARRERVPLVLRDAGHRAEDPQRRQHQADPRELARRDGRLDGRAAALALRPLGAPAQRERRRRRRRSASWRCSPSRCRRRPTAPRCRT